MSEDTIKEALKTLGGIGIPYVLITITGPNGHPYDESSDLEYEVHVLGGGPNPVNLSTREFIKALLSDAWRQVE